MVRPTDQGMTAIKKIACYSSQEEGVCHAMQGHMGTHQGWLRGRRSKGETWTRAFIVVSVRKDREGRASRLSRFRIGWFE